MSFVKKWIGCISSFLTGVLALALGACNLVAVPAPLSSAAMLGAEKVSLFDVISNAELMQKAETFTIDSHFTWLKVFAIITLVVAILLIVYSVVLALKNFNVIKSESRVFNIVTYALLGLMVVAVVGLIVTSNVYAIALETVCKKLTTLTVDVTLGAYSPVVTSVSIVALLATIVFSIIKNKKA